MLTKGSTREIEGILEEMNCVTFSNGERAANSLETMSCWCGVSGDIH